MMKFTCRHRNSLGGIDVDVIEVKNRMEAFDFSRSKKWTVVEMRPNSISKSRCTNSGIKKEDEKKKIFKIPESEEVLEELRQRRNSWMIGEIASFFPFIGWVIAAFAVFIKYDFNGLKCCIGGTIATTIALLVSSSGLGLYFGWCFSLLARNTGICIEFFLALIVSSVIILIGFDFNRIPYRRNILKGYYIHKW